MGTRRARVDGWGEFDGLFDRVFGTRESRSDFFDIPSRGFTNISEFSTVVSDGSKSMQAWKRGNNLEVTVDIPGVLSEDVKIKVKKSQLEVTTTRNNVKNTYSLQVSNVDIAQERISASVENGVLTILVKDAYKDAVAEEGFEVPLS